MQGFLFCFYALYIHFYSFIHSYVCDKDGRRLKLGGEKEGIRAWIPKALLECFTPNILGNPGYPDDMISDVVDDVKAYLKMAPFFLF